MINEDKYSSRIHLYDSPSFLRGIARLVDPLGLLSTYNNSNSPEEADYYALLSDWLTVGDDIDCAIKLHEESPQQEI